MGGCGVLLEVLERGEPIDTLTYSKFTLALTSELQLVRTLTRMRALG